MGDTLITVVSIGLAALLMFVFPLITMSERTDDVSQLSVETATTEFVDDVRTSGKLTLDKYDKFVQSVGATGNTYDVNMEIKKLDENPGKKTSLGVQDRIGDNVYYSEYTSQILNKLKSDSSLKLNEGDIFSASVKNTNLTISQQMKGFFYKLSGNDSYTIAAEHAGIVTANGK